jgi:DNA-binding NtrC family response regulator
MARTCKVLIVENDDDVRDFLGDLFEGEGYLFSMVKTGGEMRGALDGDDFDIVVIDVTQPEMRTVLRSPKPPVIGVAGQSW